MVWFMELKRIREEENMVEFEISGETHNFLNLLRGALKDIESVLFAAYKIRHPVLRDPMFVVRTDGDLNPVNAVEQAAQAIANWSNELVNEIDKKIPM